MPSTSASPIDAVASDLTPELRGMIRQFLNQVGDPHALSADDSDLVAKIFQQFVAKSVALLDQAQFEAWLQNEVEMDAPAAQAVSLELLSLPHSTTTMFDIVREAAESEARNAAQAMQAFRESFECTRLVHQRDQLAKISSLIQGSRFEPLVQALTDQGAGFRAELVARFEMYCQAGYAAADMELANTADLSTLTDGERRIVEVLRLPPLDGKLSGAEREQAQRARNGLILSAMDQRFKEVSVPIHIFRGQAEATINGKPAQRTIYLAETADASHFSLTDATFEASAHVDVAMPMHNDPERLLVGTVTSLMSRESNANSDQTARHFSAIQGAVDLDRLAWTDARGRTIRFKQLELVSYLTPFFADPTNNPHPTAFMKAMGGDTTGMQAINALPLFAEGNFVGELQRTMDQVLKTRMDPLGAICAWDPIGLLTPHDRLLEAVKVTTTAIHGFRHAAVTHPEIFQNVDGDAKKAVEALTRSIKGFHNSPFYGEQHDRALAAAANDLHTLADELEKDDPTRATGLRETFAEEARPRPDVSRDALGFLIKGYEFLDQRRVTQTAMVEHGVLSRTRRTPADLSSIEGAMAQVSCSNLPAVHRFFTQPRVLDVFREKGMGVTRVAQMIEAIEGKAHRKTLDRPRANTPAQHLNLAFEAVNECWTQMERMDPDAAMGLQKEFAKYLPLHLKQHMNGDATNLKTLPTRLQRAMTVVVGKGWRDETNKDVQENIVARLLNVAHLHPDAAQVVELCKALGTERFKGVSETSLLGDGRDQRFKLPTLRSTQEGLPAGFVADFVKSATSVGLDEHANDAQAVKDAFKPSRRTPRKPASGR